MARPTSFIGTLIPTGQMINDRQFLSLNGAGFSPENPILLGLGATLYMDVNHVVRDIRGRLARVTDFGREDDRDISGAITAISDSRFKIEGAIGGDILGFPNNPTVDYSIPQLFEATFMAVSKNRLLTQVYQFWVQDGHLHSLQSCNSVAVADCEDLDVDTVVNIDLQVVCNALAQVSGACVCTPTNIGAGLAQCLYDEYLEGAGCFWNEFGPGKTLAFFQGVATACVGTYTAVGDAFSDATATAIGDVTMTINCPGGAREIVVPISLSANDDDSDQANDSGACS